MIRKLKNGQYRIYSRKFDEKTGKRRNLGTFATREQAERTSATYNISSIIGGEAAPRSPPPRTREEGRWAMC
jgi:hypothetical protein